MLRMWLGWGLRSPPLVRCQAACEGHVLGGRVCGWSCGLRVGSLVGGGDSRPIGLIVMNMVSEHIDMSEECDGNTYAHWHVFHFSPQM